MNQTNLDSVDEDSNHVANVGINIYETNDGYEATGDKTDTITGLGETPLEAVEHYVQAVRMYHEA